LPYDQQYPPVKHLTRHPHFWAFTCLRSLHQRSRLIVLANYPADKLIKSKIDAEA
jgi:hypothetical protein